MFFTKKSFNILATVPIVAMLCLPGMAQSAPIAASYSSATGAPSLNPLDPHDLGFANISNGNNHIEIPIASFPEPGGTVLSYKLIYDSKIWSIGAGSNGLQWMPTNLPMANMGGWRFASSVDPGVVSWTLGPTCGGVNQTNAPQAYGPFFWTDPSGTRHTFNVITNNGGTCGGDNISTSGSGYADDATGYYMVVTNATTATIYAKDGTQVYPFRTDTNGNAYSVDANGNVQDPAGRTPVLVSQNGNQIFYDVLNLQGQTRNRFKVNTTTVNVNTVFNEPGVAEALSYKDINTPNALVNTAPITTIQSITLPDLSTYQFSYKGAYASVTSATLPTGGQVTFGYSVSTDVYGSPSLWLTSVQGASNAQYCLNANAPPSPGGGVGSCGYASPSCTSVTEQCSQNVVVGHCSSSTCTNENYVFNLAGTSWLASHSITANGVTASTSATFQMNTGGCAINGVCYVLPVTTTTNPPGSSASRLLSYSYDSPETANVSTTTDQYLNFEGQNSPVREADISYYPASNFVATNVINRVSSSQAKVGSSNGPSVPPFACASNSIACSSYQYDGKGNPLRASQWLNTASAGSPWPTSTLTPDGFGNVTSITDPLNNTDTIAYAADGISVTSITLPPTDNGVVHRACAQSDPNTDVPISTTGENSETTTWGYDTIGRVNSISAPDDGLTQVQYWSPNLTESDISIDTRNLVSQSLVDGYGRVESSGTQTASGTWLRQDTCYDVLGRVVFVSTPYIFSGARLNSAAAQCPATGGIGAGDSYAYDGFNRLLSVTHADGTQAQYAYTGLATQVTEESNGTVNRQRIIQSDPWGRLLGVCEISGNLPVGAVNAPSSCGMDITGTGFVTSYTYDLQDHLLSVTQPGVAERTWIYNSLGQITSETSPESGTTVYQYDAGGRLHIRTSPAPNNETSGSVNTIDTLYGYDAIDRPTSKQYVFSGTSTPEPNTPSAFYFYDLPAVGASGTPPALQWPSLTQQKLVGRLSEEWTGTSSTAIAAQAFTYTPGGSLAANSACTPRTCGNSSYLMSYTYNNLGQVLTVTNAAGVTFTNVYDGAARFQEMDSSLSDVNHPAQLISNVQYGVFGPTSATFGNGIEENLTYNPLTGFLNLIDDIPPSEASNAGGSVNDTVYGVASTGTITISGSERQNTAPIPASTTLALLANQPSQPDSFYSALVPINGTEQSTANGIGSITIGGPGEQSTTIDLEGTKQVCLPKGGCSYEPTLTPETVYDSGTVSIAVNGRSIQVSYGETSTQSTVASALALAINNDATASSYVTASSSGNIVSLVAKVLEPAGNYSLAASGMSTYVGPGTNYIPASYKFSGSSFVPTTSGASMVSGPVTYDTGTITLLVAGPQNNSCDVANPCPEHQSVTYNYGQGDTIASVITGLTSKLMINGQQSGNNLLLFTVPSGWAYQISSASSDGYNPPSFTFPQASGNLNSTYDIYNSGWIQIYVEDSSFQAASISTTNADHYAYQYSGPATSLSILQGLAQVINSDPSALVTASAYAGPQVGVDSMNYLQITTKAAGATMNYPCGVSESYNAQYFPGPEFPVLQCQSLSGGVNAGTVSDSGVVSLTVNGYTDSVPYSQNSTPLSIATALVATVNADSAALVYATLPSPAPPSNAASVEISLASRTGGVLGQYTFSISSATTNTQDFTGTSFPVSASSNTAGTASSASLSGGQNPLYGEVLNYAPNGLVSHASDFVNGSWNYSYDAMNRLTSASQTGGVSLNWTYDNAGNRWNQTIMSGSAPQPAYSFSGQNNRLDNYSYDEAGNLLNDGRHSYTYDAEGRMVAVDGSLAYVYDAQGERVKSPQYEYLNSMGSLALLDPSMGTLLSTEIYANGRHIATYTNGTTYFVFGDHLGTERVRADIDGNPCVTIASLPFGDSQVISGGCNVSPFGYTGLELDATGLNHTLFRQYSSTMGRWHMPDPSGVAAVDPTDPQTWNRYAYVNNDPVNSTDNLGLDCLFCWFGGGGGDGGGGDGGGGGDDGGYGGGGYGGGGYGAPCGNCGGGGSSSSGGGPSPGQLAQQAEMVWGNSSWYVKLLSGENPWNGDVQPGSFADIFHFANRSAQIGMASGALRDNGTATQRLFAALKDTWTGLQLAAALFPGGMEFKEISLAGENLSHLNGAIGEFHGYRTAIEELGHIGIQEPGRVTVPGPDYITFDPGGQGTIWVWDAKYRGPNGGSVPADLSADKLQRWMPEVQQAIANLPEGALKESVQNALQSGRVQGGIFRWPK